MYNIILLPLIAGLVAQVIKFFLRSNDLKFSFKNLSAYSGMPSGHTAMVSSLATITALSEGINSPDFALAFIFAVIVIRDALGIRQYLGEHGRTLNKLVQDLDEDKYLDKTYPHLLERIGHTPLQVLVGAIIGVSISFLGHFLF